jgi:lysophospholipase L1-like esterase
MGIRRRVIIGASAVPVVAAVVLGVEIQLARIQPSSRYGPPLVLSGLLPPNATADPLRVTWLGDSTAAGVGASGVAGALPRQVAALDSGPEKITALAVSGARIGDVVRDQLPRVPLDTDVVLISVGANDVVHLSTTGGFRHTYERLLAALPRQASIVLLGVPDMGSPTRLAQPLRAIVGWRGRAFARIVRALATEHHVGFVDIAGRTGPVFRHQPGKYFFSDHYHPNDAGYRLWAEAIAPALATARGQAIARRAAG